MNWRICNNSKEIELMFNDPPYSGSIFIDDEGIFACCTLDNYDGYAKTFPRDTNLKMVEKWIKEKLSYDH